MRALGLPEVLAYALSSVQLPLRVVSRVRSATAEILPALLHLPPAWGLLSITGYIKPLISSMTLAVPEEEAPRQGVMLLFSTAAIFPALLHLPPAAEGGKNYQLRYSVG